MKKATFCPLATSHDSLNSCVQAQQKKWLSRWYRRFLKLMPILQIVSFGVHSLPFQKALLCHSPVVQCVDFPVSNIVTDLLLQPLSNTGQS